MATTRAVTEPRTVLQLCGGVELKIAGQSVGGALPGGKATVLLACLAMSRRPLGRDELIDALWPVRTPSDPQAVLSTLLSRLRRVLGSEALPGREHVELRLPEPVWFDVRAAGDAVRKAREALAALAWSRLLEQCRLALGILGRSFLVGHESPWIDACRRDLEDLHLAALELEGRGGLAVGEGGLDRAVRAARMLIAIAPYREVGYRLLMEALESEGNVAEAVRVYERLRVLLRDELGIAPALELRVLHERLLTGEAPEGSGPGIAQSSGHRRAPISVPRRAAFVGRANELDRLKALGSSGGRRLIAVAGEPGIGKTRLVSEFVGRAEANGALVLFGRCDEETLVPYQPFIEALRSYVGRCPVEQLRRQVADGGPELSRILPALRRRLPDLPEPPRSESETERFRLFELVAAFLARIDASAPLVLVLDDLHWADRSTLSLLRQLFRSRESDARPPLIVATYRSTEMEDAPAEALADLDREGLVGRISLAGLAAAEISELMADWAGAQPPPELARAVHEETEGNPFFVEEVLRQLAEAGAVAPGEGRWAPEVVGVDALGVSEGVRHVVARRLSRIAPDARRVLTIAAAVGREFSFDALERLTDFSGDALAEALEQAVAARLIAERPGALGLYGFSHALIRQTLYEELTLTRRVLLHRRIGETLEELYAGSLAAHLAELAHHFHEAAQDGDPTAAIDYAERAGERAALQLAYEEAARHYTRALRALELAPERQEERRCELLIARGEAERRAGDPAYRDTLLAGARLATELEDPERLARAALANNRGFFSSTGGIDEERVSVLNNALKAYDTTDSPTRARLLAHLGVELVHSPDWDRRARLSDEALAMARRTGHAETLAIVLNQRFAALWGPRTLSERRAVAAEAVEIAERVDDRTLAFYPPFFAAHAAMEAGELEQADTFLARSRTMADELGEPTLQWFLTISRAKRALITAAPSVAEQLAFEALELGQSAGQDDAFAWMATQVFVARLNDGRLEELLEVIEGVSELFVEGSTARRAADAMVATALCESGRSADARAIFDERLAEELTDLPHDWGALAIPALCALICARLDDARRAQTLYTLIEPFAERLVDMGPAWLGSASHYLGLLAGTLDRLDEANTHFARAADAHRALDATPWFARTHIDWAAMLLQRSNTGDARRAGELLSEALVAARALGLETVKRRAAALLERCS